MAHVTSGLQCRRTDPAARTVAVGRLRRHCWHCCDLFRRRGAGRDVGVLRATTCTSLFTTGGIFSAFPATELPGVASERCCCAACWRAFWQGCSLSGFAALFGEPQIELAIGFEIAMEHAAGHAPEPELVSRAVQRGAGLLTAGVASGAALGGLVALVFALAYQRVGRLSPRALAALLAAGGFVAVVLVPQLKYPANPPSIGEPETIGAAHRALFRDDPDCSCRTGACRAAGTQSADAVRRLECLTDRDAWRSSASLPRSSLSCPMSTKCRTTFPPVVLWRFRLAVARHAVGALGVVRRDLRRAGGARVLCATPVQSIEPIASVRPPPTPAPDRDRQSDPLPSPARSTAGSRPVPRPRPAAARRSTADAWSRPDAGSGCACRRYSRDARTAARLPPA